MSAGTGIAARGTSDHGHPQGDGDARPDDRSAAQRVQCAEDLRRCHQPQEGEQHLDETSRRSRPARQQPGSQAPGPQPMRARTARTPPKPTRKLPAESSAAAIIDHRSDARTSGGRGASGVSRARDSDHGC